MAQQKEKGSLAEALRRIEHAKETSERQLDLSDCHLLAIPESINDLPKLESLDLARNSITTISNSIRLPQLQTLRLLDNGITEFPEAITQFYELQSLSLTRNQLAQIPDSIGRLTRLTKLYLGGSALEGFPDSVLQLRALGTLYLWGCRIGAIPRTITALSELRSLYLGSNQITEIPDWINHLSKLEELNLSENQIATIPDSLALLPSLEILGLDTNHISVIPDSLSDIRELHTLELSGNSIEVIPDSLGLATNLRILDLRNNRIRSVSDKLMKLPRLGRLFLHGNPLLGLPEEILGPEPGRSGDAKAPREILSYLARIADSRPLNEAKLILVGQGSVGKTSLVKALTTGKFKKGEKNTEGIKISDWTCLINRSSQAKVHIWDFGGQELMHATHQFFLTQRSLYLLVLNRRTGGVDREADYWFRLIRAFGGKDAPVIVVLNKQKSEPFDVNREGWFQKYSGNLKDFVASDCEDRKSITQLKRKIIQELDKMASLKARFPRRWFSIKDTLSTMSKEHISFEEYQKLCRELGENDPISQASLAGFLHDLGIALNYSQDPRLRFNYVLKPEWVTQGIYALLHAFVAQKGVFTHAQSESVLEKKKYSAADTQFILGLMERFELSFSLRDKQNRVLIPELLADQQPKEASAFKPEECLNFGYKYSILPEGLLPRFIARTHHLSKAESRWKSGVILEDSSTNCRALVQADAADAEVRIHIDGPKEARSELLGIIRFNFEVIHADYESKPIPQVYSAAAPADPLPLPKLEALVRSRATTVPVVLPDASVINENIAALIEPVRSVPTPLKLFLSYSHKEEEFINELRKDLKLMEMNGLIQPWYDRALIAGQEWEPTILDSLNAADVVVCQISRDYLFSDYCRKELDTAIKRNRAGKAALAAYILNDCGWKEYSKLAKVQMLPADGKPLADWADANKYWRSVIDGIQKAIKKFQLEGGRAKRAARADQ